MDFTVSALINRIFSTELLKTLSICVLLLGFHVLFLFGLLPGSLILISYVVGVLVVHLLIQYLSNISDILSFLTSVILQKCCPHLSKRRVTEPNKKDKVIVPLDIDDALDKFMNRLINHYMIHWYASISADANFPHEIRTLVEKVVSNCYRRLSHVNIETLFLKKILPVCLNHVHSYDKLKTDANVSHLHIAVHSRTAEFLYLQNVSKSVMTYILQDSELQCKSFSILFREILTRNIFLALSDTVCNPDTLNMLLLHYLKGYYHFLSAESGNVVQRVVLLSKFVSVFEAKPLYSCLRPDLATIFKDEDLKDAFMRYLRVKSADYLLQFCIDIEIFRSKLSRQNFDLETEELDLLYRDAWDLYSVYFSNYSPNCVQFEEDYASVVRKALSKDILKLQSAKTLSDAYDYVYAQLQDYCNDFYNSNEFYSWLYGRCETSELVRSRDIFQLGDEVISGCSPDRKTGFELSNKLNIIKEVLKPNQILEGQIQELADDTENLMELGEDVNMTASTNDRNINTWKISIPAIGSRLDPITNKAYTVFVIQTQTESGNDWLVERRPNDFYTLDLKLTEFHGSFRDVQLPPRRLMTSRSECIQMYGDYLNKLVKIKELKSSELLSTFLSSNEDFEEEETGFGKLFRKSVVPTLRKERGQSLDAFINSFVNSCKATKYEWNTIGKTDNSRTSESASRTYVNNFNVNPDISQQIFYTESRSANDTIYEKPSTSILCIGIRLFNVQDRFVKLFLTLQSFFGGMIDQLIVHFTKRYLTRILTISNIAYFIGFSEKAIFESKRRSNSEETLLHLSETLNSLKNDWLHPLYVLLYENIQNARLNKQLYYQTMDVAIEALFPELNEVGRR